MQYGAYMSLTLKLGLTGNRLRQLLRRQHGEQTGVVEAVKALMWQIPTYAERQRNRIIALWPLYLFQWWSINLTLQRHNGLISAR